MHFFRSYSYEIQVDQKAEDIASSIQGIRWVCMLSVDIEMFDMRFSVTV